MVHTWSRAGNKLRGLIHTCGHRNTEALVPKTRLKLHSVCRCSSPQNQIYTTVLWCLVRFVLLNGFGLQRFKRDPCSAVEISAYVE